MVREICWEYSKVEGRVGSQVMFDFWGSKAGNERVLENGGLDFNHTCGGVLLGRIFLLGLGFDSQKMLSDALRGKSPVLHPSIHPSINLFFFWKTNNYNNSSKKNCLLLEHPLFGISRNLPTSFLFFFFLYLIKLLLALNNDQDRHRFSIKSLQFYILLYLYIVILIPKISLINLFFIPIYI